MCNNKVTVEKQEEALQLSPNLHQHLGWINHHRSQQLLLTFLQKQGVKFLQLLHCSANFFIDVLISPARPSSSLPQLQNLYPAETTHGKTPPEISVTKIELYRSSGTANSFVIQYLFTVLILSCAAPSPFDKMSGQLWTNESVVLHIKKKKRHFNFWCFLQNFSDHEDLMYAARTQQKSHIRAESAFPCMAHVAACFSMKPKLQKPGLIWRNCTSHLGCPHLRTLTWVGASSDTVFTLLLNCCKFCASVRINFATCCKKARTQPFKHSLASGIQCWKWGLSNFLCTEEVLDSANVHYRLLCEPICQVW